MEKRNFQIKFCVVFLALGFFFTACASNPVPVSHPNKVVIQNGKVSLLSFSVNDEQRSGTLQCGTQRWNWWYDASQKRGFAFVALDYFFDAKNYHEICSLKVKDKLYQVAIHFDSPM